MQLNVSFFTVCITKYRKMWIMPFGILFSNEIVWRNYYKYNNDSNQEIHRRARSSFVVVAVGVIFVQIEDRSPENMTNEQNAIIFHTNYFS